MDILLLLILQGHRNGPPQQLLLIPILKISA